MRKVLLCMVLLSVVAVSGCSARGVIGGSHVPGFIYSDATLPVGATGIVGDKEGRACSSSVLGWFASGDSSIKAAMATGGITEVSTVDVKVDNTLNIYTKYCTIVRGK